MTDTQDAAVRSTDANEHGYRSFSLGEFTFGRDEYFAHISWPTGSHTMSIDDFLRDAGARPWQRELAVPVLTEALKQSA